MKRPAAPLVSRAVVVLVVLLIAACTTVLVLVFNPPLAFIPSLSRASCSGLVPQSLMYSGTALTVEWDAAVVVGCAYGPPATATCVVGVLTAACAPLPGVCAGKTYAINGTSILVINSATGALIATVTGFVNPTAFTLSPLGDILYVVGNNILRAFTTVQSLVEILPANVYTDQGLGFISVATDGVYIFVVNAVDSVVLILNLDRTLRIEIGVNQGPSTIALAGGDFWVPSSLNTSISIVNVAAATASTLIVAVRGHDILVVSGVAYVVGPMNAGSIGLLAINVATSTVLNVVTMPGSGPHRLAYAQGNIYISSFGMGSAIAVYDIATQLLSAFVTDHCSVQAMAASSSNLYVACADTIVAFPLATMLGVVIVNATTATSIRVCS